MDFDSSAVEIVHIKTNCNDQQRLFNKKIMNSSIPHYAKYQSKINLEVISASAANRMLIFTYLTFIICILVSLSYTYVALLQQKHIFHAPLALAALNTSIIGDSGGYFFNRTILNIQNVNSFELDVVQSNFTSIVNWSTGSRGDVCSIVTFSYHVSLWACYNDQGCGNKFASPASNAKSFDIWHHVQTETQYNISTDMCKLLTDKLSVQLLPPRFQNQASF